ncbi:MAG: hypothetical protein IJT83_13885 [Victivallales bacterium]|nr:hypothetical protein [Victivallales bacterium]
MTAMQIMWAIIGALWAALLGFCSWTVSQLKDLEKQLAKQDKDKSIKLASIETQLANINATLLELKKDLKEMR